MTDFAEARGPEMPEEQIFKLYESLALWRNPFCEQCKAVTTDAGDELSGPIAIWQVGRQYQTHPYRLMLIGKTARGTIREPHDTTAELDRAGYINGTIEADNYIRTDRKAAYWHYTSELIRRVFGSVDIGWECVAFTNLIKCNASMSVDTTSITMATNCIEKLSVVWRELSLLRPRNVILYTGTAYDEYIANHTAGCEVHDVTDRHHFIRNGAKKMYWWDRRYVRGDKLCFRLLRTSHPERQTKDGFVEHLARWVTCNAE